jgi:hypothetical protein
MTNRDEVLELIQSHPEGLDDDDISQLTGITPRQQVQQLCNKLASSKRIRRESVEKAGKRRKIHNFPLNDVDNLRAQTFKDSETGKWSQRLSALVAATGQSERELLEEALHLLALEVLKNVPENGNTQNGAC